jgi:hypothetical protein
MTKLRTHALAALFLLAVTSSGADLRLGIIGTDTSHVTAFTKVLNDTSSPDHIPGAKVVAAYKGGSPDVEESAKRIDGYAAELRDKWNVKFVDSISGLCPLVDGILLESLDGRPHLEQFIEAAKCGKPVFIDKPLAGTLDDAMAIAKLGLQMKVPWFSSSSLRYSDVDQMRAPKMTGAIVWAPGPMEPHQPLDLTWYGVHGVEMLYTIFGTGCEEVSRMSSENEDVITGKWKDGRLGVVHLERPYGKYGAIVFLPDRKIDARPDLKFSYVPLVKEIVTFMQTGKPPVPNDVTIEMFAFMDAAQKSKAQDGKAVKLADTSVR